MTEQFKREDRYIVIKRKLLRKEQEENLLEWLHFQGVAQVPKAVVVEGDWPEYEAVWRMIEERVGSSVPAQQKKAKEDAERGLI